MNALWLSISLLTLLCRQTVHCFQSPLYLSKIHVSRDAIQSTLRTSPRGIGQKAHVSPIYSLATPSEEDQKEGGGAIDKKIAGRKKRIILGYRAALVAYLVSCTVSLLAWIVKNGVSPPRMLILPLYSIATGPFLASGIAYILSGAAYHDRLSSDTYKRLNLFLGEYAIILLCMTPCVIHLPIIGGALNAVATVFALVNSIKGYGYGVLGWDKKSGTTSSVLEDFVSGVRSSMKTLISVPKNFQSAGYMAATLLLGVFKIDAVIQVLQLSLQWRSISMDLVAPWAIRIANLALLIGIVFTLKDAADRSRLDGTTFIELNFMSSIVFGIMSGKQKKKP